MSIIVVGFEILLLLAQAVLGILVGYLVFLTIVSLWANPKTDTAGRTPATKFLVLIPAHNEELLLPKTLQNLAQLAYPKSLLSIYVVADNCTDRTAELARSGGANVLSRTNAVERGKGYALQWGLGQIRQLGQKFDAVVILDADSTVSANFLKVMDARIARGEKIIQAYYAVQNPDESWVGAIRYAAFTVVHYLRSQARNVLGFSVGLKGNGMTFREEVLKNHAWSGSVTEDIDFHMALILSGERVVFAPDAVVWGEMPNTLANTQTQHARWESGRIEMARKYVPQLLSAAWNEFRANRAKRTFLLLDGVIEHIIPPLSILITASVFCLIIDIAAFLGIRTLPSSLPRAATSLPAVNLIIGLGLMIGQGLYIFTGLRLAKAPKTVYRSLLLSPLYLFWKIREYLSLFTSRGKNNQGWIRTMRNRG